MIIIDINKLELPEFDIILAVPICIPLGFKRELYFNIPDCEKYFTFEAHYIKILKSHFRILSKVSFLDYKEFKSMKLKKQMFAQLKIVMQNESFKRDFIRIIKKYFTANHKIKLKYINPIQLQYLFLLIHKCIETVKKKFTQFLAKVDSRMSETFSTFSKPSSTKIEPRF
jgi:hypothetical protein